MRLRSAVLVALAALALSACAAAKDQLAIYTVNDCIQQSCKDPNAQDYTSCEASCRSAYGR